MKLSKLIENLIKMKNDEGADYDPDVYVWSHDNKKKRLNDFAVGDKVLVLMNHPDFDDEDEEISF